MFAPGQFHLIPAARVVKLSPDGEKFLPAAMRVVEEFQRAENYARDLKEIKKSLMR
ncbi:hypothetical protein ONJ16_25800, partial [Salmonella enterica subsp. enterica serovar Montevideo]|nr:hypothetical protein [Salmonella enterica subsp. enterica serovar Montevideo]